MIILRILTMTMEAKNYFIEKNKFKLKKGLGTREAIEMIRMLCQRSLDSDNKLSVSFVDFEMASIRVK